jgi:hypothetical protein
MFQNTEKKKTISQASGIIVFYDKTIDAYAL